MGKKTKVKDSDSDELSGSEIPSNFKVKQRPVLDFKIVIVQDEADSREYCWSKLWAGPGRSTKRKFCIICGCPANYTCVSCAKHKPFGFERNFCSIRCQTVHNEADCGKPIDMTHW
ncbi:Protein SEY1 homolog [Babesia microti strain RI]|uniref:Protein SEY1 homolog n=1 Tax=Babesia microti (strain RI) TaxID=1133968 RepID=A0A1R4AAM8_BABMR|nr:Protein SEY1 homolog [Babesia microti strain RI]SJK86051.1 Protein SEY1 homolog [Babesia microti strain RI]|eukprot:XP_021338248.1 Protein SEY1 homolog [Babesia microti strain RI]